MYNEILPECECCGRDDVELTLVRKNTWYCNHHLQLFTKNWSISPNLEPFEKDNSLLNRQILDNPKDFI